MGLGLGLAGVVAHHPARRARLGLGMAQHARVEARQLLAAASAAAAATQRAARRDRLAALVEGGEQRGVGASLAQHAAEEAHAHDAEDEEDEGLRVRLGLGSGLGLGLGLGLD